MRHLRLPPILSLLLLLTGCSGLPPGYPYQVTPAYAVDDPQFARTMGSLFGPPLESGNAVKTLKNGDEMFPAMLYAIRTAKVSVTLETFIYNKGEIGDRFTQALEERARAGVHVHVLIDPVGSERLDRTQIRRLNDAGAQGQLYHALRWFDLSAPARLNNPTPRKILLIHR